MYQEECKLLLINCGAVIRLWASSEADCEYPLDAKVINKRKERKSENFSAIKNGKYQDNDEQIHKRPGKEE